MTVNQALDQIFTSYQKKDMNQYPSIQTLKQNLIELKIKYGGNTVVENENIVKNTIKYGSSKPEDWKKIILFLFSFDLCRYGNKSTNSNYESPVRCAGKL